MENSETICIDIRGKIFNISRSFLEKSTFLDNLVYFNEHWNNLPITKVDLDPEIFRYILKHIEMGDFIEMLNINTIKEVLEMSNYIAYAPLSNYGGFRPKELEMTLLFTKNMVYKRKKGKIGEGANLLISADPNFIDFMDYLSTDRLHIIHNEKTNEKSIYMANIVDSFFEFEVVGKLSHTFQTLSKIQDHVNMSIKKITALSFHDQYEIKVKMIKDELKSMPCSLANFKIKTFPHIHKNNFHEFSESTIVIWEHLAGTKWDAYYSYY